MKIVYRRPLCFLLPRPVYWLDHDLSHLRQRGQRPVLQQLRRCFERSQLPGLLRAFEPGG